MDIMSFGVPWISVCRNNMALLVVLGEVVVLAAARFWMLAEGDDRSTLLVLIMVSAVPKVPAPENDIGKIWSLIQYLWKYTYYNVSCSKYKLTAVVGSGNDANSPARGSCRQGGNRGIKYTLDFFAIHISSHIVCTYLENKHKSYVWVLYYH